MKTFLDNKIRVLGLLLGLCIIGYVYTTSCFYMKAGDAFFGEVPSLYNVTLAEFFFTNAAYPLLGSPAPYAHYQLSRTYFIQGKLNAALDEAEKELSFYPEHERTYYILGLTLGYLNREEEAIDAFQKFIEFDPSSWAARNDTAWLQFRIGDIDGALATIEPAVANAGNPWIQNTYGTLLLNKGRYAEARQALLYAQKEVNQMTEASWGAAYPGNDPRIYRIGLEAMKSSIAENLKLLEAE
jgi:tetratricopeptide (TPR) repeat protein